MNDLELQKLKNANLAERVHNLELVVMVLAGTLSKISLQDREEIDQLMDNYSEYFVDTHGGTVPTQEFMRGNS